MPRFDSPVPHRVSLPRGRWRTRASTVLAALATLGVAVATAQIPSEFTNLQVLPKEISQRELLDRMRSFSLALDVSCSHCHVGSDPEDLSTFEFALDDKPTKRTARVMLEMVRAINDEYLPLASERDAPRVRVDCMTCHHGTPIPTRLEDELASALDDGGTDAAIARYRELRDRYYGRSTYDFGEEPLIALGRRLARDGRIDQAIAMLELGLEVHPGSAASLLTLGEIHFAAGDRAAAARAFRELAAVDPGNAWAEKRLGELGSADASEAADDPRQ